MTRRTKAFDLPVGWNSAVLVPADFSIFLLSGHLSELATKAIDRS